MRRVWPDSFVEEANLTVNISALRKALGDTINGQEYIETVPKRGYRFIASTQTEGVDDLIAVGTVSAEELGRAIMSAAGLDPENPLGSPKLPPKS